MQQKTKDRRIRKTKTALRTALAQLLLEKDLSRITVKELTELADVNRGTFYFHYQDIYAFVEMLENDIIESVQNALHRCDPSDTTQGLRPLLEIINQLFEAAPPGIPLLTGNRGTSLANKLTDLIREQYLYTWLKTYTHSDNKQELDYCCSFLISGIFAMVMRWLGDSLDSRISASALAEQMNQIGIHGLDAFRN